MAFVNKGEAPVSERVLEKIINRAQAAEFGRLSNPSAQAIAAFEQNVASTRAFNEFNKRLVPYKNAVEALARPRDEFRPSDFARNKGLKEALDQIEADALELIAFAPTDIQEHLGV